jgi:ribosomal protein S18 acetylase RimI-like enzyme
MVPPAVLPFGPGPRDAAPCYFKRFKMEVVLEGLPAPTLPAGYRALAWSAGLLDAHAEALFRSFQGEIDANLFPSLAHRDGCACLMTEIARRADFVPEATWLLVGPSGPCGTVQGLRERRGVGAIQNIGVLTAHRGRGLGEGLLLHALHGFRLAGAHLGHLEVTAQNDAAVRLYRRIGFRRTRVLYKAVPVLRPADGLLD